MLRELASKRVIFTWKKHRRGKKKKPPAGLSFYGHCWFINTDTARRSSSSKRMTTHVSLPRPWVDTQRRRELLAVSWAILYLHLNQMSWCLIPQGNKQPVARLRTRVSTLFATQHMQREGPQRNLFTNYATNPKTNARVGLCCREKEELRHFDLMDEGESFYSLKNIYINK